MGVLSWDSPPLLSSPSNSDPFAPGSPNKASAAANLNVILRCIFDEDDVDVSFCKNNEISEGTLKQYIKSQIHSLHTKSEQYNLSSSPRPDGRMVFDRSSIAGVLQLEENDLESRCNFASVRTVGSVKAGKWQYEVTLGTAGKQQLGWSTRMTPFTNEHVRSWPLLEIAPGRGSLSACHVLAMHGLSCLLEVKRRHVCRPAWRLHLASDFIPPLMSRPLHDKNIWPLFHTGCHVLVTAANCPGLHMQTVSHVLVGQKIARRFRFSAYSVLPTPLCRLFVASDVRMLCCYGLSCPGLDQSGFSPATDLKRHSFAFESCNALVLRSASSTKKAKSQVQATEAIMRHNSDRLDVNALLHRCSHDNEFARLTGRGRF